LQQHLPFTVCAEGVHTSQVSGRREGKTKMIRQQHLPFTVLKRFAGYERTIADSHTSQVPERSEGKTKVIRQQYLPFTVLKLLFFKNLFHMSTYVAIVLTVYGIETPKVDC